MDDKSLFEMLVAAGLYKKPKPVTVFAFSRKTPVRFTAMKTAKRPGRNRVAKGYDPVAKKWIKS